MKNYIFLIFIISLFFISCTPNSNSDKQSLKKGKLIIGDEISSFTPCGSNMEYWIYDTSGRLDSMYNQSLSQLSHKELYQPMYCEIEVVEEEYNENEFPNNYDGIYRVNKIVDITPLVDSIECDITTKNYLMGGVDSVWNVKLRKISKSHFYYILTYPNKEDSVSGSLAQTKMLNDENLSTELFESIDTTTNKVSLKFDINETCTDAEREVYNGTLYLYINDKEYVGCGDYSY